ncbi:MBL fold metallo-hydrolase, partial [Adlercreutzia sp. ZJ305]
MRHVQLVHENPDVYLIRVPFANVITTETNCYVVRDGDDALVVDTGAPSPFSERLLREALRDLGIDATSARYFLTHAHYDHAGLIPQLAGPGAAVYLGERELESVTADFGRRSTRYVCRRFREEGVPARIARPDNERINVSVSFDERAFRLQTVGEGEEIRVGAQAFRVVEMPGHTRGHLALFHPASGICFTGDHVLFVLSPSIPLYLDGTSGLGAYFDSLDKLAGLGCSRLLISHGELRDGFQERISQIKAHHLRREDAIAGIVEAAAREEAAALVAAGTAAGCGTAGANGVAAAGREARANGVAAGR